MGLYHRQFRLRHQNLRKLDIQCRPQLALRQRGKLLEVHPPIVENSLGGLKHALRRFGTEIARLHIEHGRLAGAFFVLPGRLLLKTR